MVLKHWKMPSLHDGVFTILKLTQNLSCLVRTFLFVAFVTVSLLCLRVRCKRRRSPFSSLTSTVSRSHCLMTRTTQVSFGTLSMYFPLKTLFSHFPLNVNFLSFLTLGDWSSFHNIVPNPEISSSHTRPTRSEAEQNPVILTCTNLPGSHLKAIHSLIITLDPSNVEILEIVILQTHIEQICESLYCFISPGCTDILTDHVRNLSLS